MTVQTVSARTTVLTDALVSEIREVVAHGLDPELTAHLVGERLRPYLGRAELLTEQQVEGDPDSYRQHVLHAEPDGSFSVVALVWLPGQRTSIHDHVSWCVAGVHQGRETERRYRLVPDGSAARLTATEDVDNPQGSVCGFAPPGDIHRVQNGCSSTAISIHVYGADVVRLGTSIRRVYRLPDGALD
ncbi:putative metal-dependent enzyme (double-stranded beta helix superfamily) [Kitasatospora sp. MAP12-15]|uniref:cysteine dioxygenase family protein n=1 Tax=unclassified Kitasatospora TaxID=2633591 RepID=UPI002474EF0E|nr:cysteine dioxygenase family protein [Kitasatospora sp. MAP12-44]MDH6109148.1 putative metal-dependent enzyme (double-stranded beta helix superfamily) [Kitasatospora sp. MAP12-44]